ncbi:MAG: ATP-dependent Clp protease ATP-binding subunit [Flavobacteriales bacterium]|nr:ATP-dependent Clp protease ATP-binding subunit [Flavobacteriales bacterium]
MLEAILPNYQKHHKLGIENAAIIGAVELAKRYVKDRCLPASAVGLMDQTMSAVRLLMDTSGSELEKLEKELDGLTGANQQGGVDLAKELDWFELRMGRSLSPILLAMLEEGKKEEAADTPRAEILKDRIVRLKAASNEKREKVYYTDVVSIVAHNTGIPIGRLQSGERERLLNMAEMLGQRVMGQDHALSTVTESMIDARSGLARDGKPKGAFFFLGPTGTGKTELTKAIAEQLFNDESALLRFDMSEFKEERDVQKLIGTSPGLVGYEEGGQLVNSIRRQPYSVVLFDEIEKAHPKIFDIFLQILGEGFVTDNKGNKGDFSNALIVFTSNIGAQAIAAIFKEGRVPTTDELSAILGKSEGFRPELIGRFVALLEEGYSELYGARPILGVIRNRLRKPVSRTLVSGGTEQGTLLEIVLGTEGEVQVKKR